jgi:hypothetical protein
MATYFLLAKIFSRGRGGRATRAAAYRAGERIRDERSGESYNHTNRRDIAHTEIFLPSDLTHRPDFEWARDRAKLWNAAEFAGKQRNSRLAREVLVYLPPELTPTQRINLARTFSQEFAEKYRCAVDLAVHEPRPGTDDRHHHAHILMTTREVIPEGLGARTTLDLSGTERHARGLGPSKTDYLLIRERWAQVTNEALLAAGIDARVDHRSYLDQGVNRDPVVSMPAKVVYSERKYGRSTAGDEIRARHRERVEARLKGKEELARVVRKQKEELRQRAVLAHKEQTNLPRKIRYAALTRDERLELRRQKYHANKDVLSQRQREQYRQNREDRREKARMSPNAPTSPTAEQSVKNWLAYRESHSRGPTAEESVKNWLAYRESHDRGPTAEESVKNWLAYRAAQTQTGSTTSKSKDNDRELEEKNAEDDRHIKRDRDHDRSL